MRFQNADCSVFCPFNLYDYGLSQPTKHGPYGTVNGQANGQMAKWPGSKACGQHGLQLWIRLVRSTMLSQLSVERVGHPASWPSKRGSNIVSLYEDHIIASLRRSARLQPTEWIPFVFSVYLDGFSLFQLPFCCFIYLLQFAIAIAINKVTNKKHEFYVLYDLLVFSLCTNVENAPPKFMIFFFCNFQYCFVQHIIS